MPKGYWIGHVTVHGPDEYAAYRELNSPVIERFGGKFLVRGGQSEAPETPQRDRHVVVEFPDYATALACYHSEDYQAAAKIRMKNADSDVVIVEGQQ